MDEVLDDKRRTYQGLPSLLTKIANNISGDLSKEFAESISIVYFPQVSSVFMFLFESYLHHKPIS